MEFHEKLQQLRKQHNLTQEQLAEQLFVSRTAVSKWESGRGYPNLESLKCISKLFSVSIDELLLSDELIELAETENRSNLNRISRLVFGVLDLITAAFLFLPLFGQSDGAYIRSVTLPAYTGITGPLRVLYFAVFIVISLFGLMELLTELTDYEKGSQIYKPCSIALYAAAILLFALSRQPYITAFLFLLFLVKIALLIKESHIK